jgi:hypothetical protein
MDRKVASVMLAGAVLAVLLAWVSTSGEVHLWHESTEAVVTNGPRGGVATGSTIVTDATVTSLPGVDVPPKRWRLPAWVGSLLRLMLAAIAAASVVAVWRGRPRWSLGTLGPAVPPPRDPVADVVADISADAEAQIAALQEGPPRNAITACWMRLEEIVDRAGIRRDAADTSTDLVRKVLANTAADPDATEELAELFREARFSSHPMGEPERSAAVEALRRVHAGIAGDHGRFDARPVEAASR